MILEQTDFAPLKIGVEIFCEKIFAFSLRLRDSSSKRFNFVLLFPPLNLSYPLLLLSSEAGNIQHDEMTAGWLRLS